MTLQTSLGGMERALFSVFDWALSLTVTIGNFSISSAQTSPTEEPEEELTVTGRELNKPAYSEGWQSDFIQSNLLTIGYFAWHGFVNFGHGLTAFDVDAQVLDLQPNPLVIVPFTTQFTPASKTIEYLQREGVESTAISLVQSAIQSYDPHHELVLLLTVNHQPEIVLLQNLAITPPECYEQLCNRWQEFMITKVPNDHYYL